MKVQCAHLRDAIKTLMEEKKQWMLEKKQNFEEIDGILFQTLFFSIILFSSLLADSECESPTPVLLRQREPFREEMGQEAFEESKQSLISQGAEIDKGDLKYLFDCFHDCLI